MVCDSYDLDHHIEKIIGETLKEKIEAKGEKGKKQMKKKPKYFVCIFAFTTLVSPCALYYFFLCAQIISYGQIMTL